MRVGILVYALDRPLSGISRFTVELVRHLADLPDAPQITLFSAGGLGELADLNLPHVRLPGCRLLPGLLTLGNLWLPRLARRYDLDILHDMTGLTPLLFGAGGAQPVVTLYDVIPVSFPGVSTVLDALVYRRWLPRLLPQVEAILTISEASRHDITRYMGVQPERVHNIQAGRSPRYAPAPPQEIERVRARHALPDSYILYVGSVQARKNLKRVLEAFALCADIPHKLVVVGAKNWRYSEIEAAFEGLNLGERVLFTGYVPDEDLPAIYSGAEVFIFPSLYEGFGLPVLEALACGVPTITSDVSSLPEVAGDAALLVNPHSVEDIAGALGRLTSDANLRAELREKALARAACFGWHITAQKTLSIYTRLLQEKVPPTS